MDNNWVVHSVIKQVDAESLKKRKEIQGGGDKKNDDVGMEIL